MERAYAKTIRSARNDYSLKEKGVSFPMRTLFKGILLLYAILCCYVGMRSLSWLRAVIPGLHPLLFWTAYLSLHLSVVVGRGLRLAWLSWVLTVISNIWMGIFLFLLAGILSADFIRLVGSMAGIYLPTLRQGGAIVLGATLLTAALATVQAYRIHLTEYEITLSKPCDTHEQLSVAVFSDLHLGKMIGMGRLQQVVDRINEMDVDMVFIAGDMFDNDIAGVRDLMGTADVLAGLKARYGVYACLGNHDVDLRVNSGVDDIALFYERAGVRLLRDEAVELEGLTILGRLDYRPIGLDQKRLTIGELLLGVDDSKPILLLDHQPEDIVQEARHGVDLTICGHTHGGQVFPGAFITDRLFANDYGHLELDGAHSIVSSGVGFWGPPMRTASRSEIVHILVNFS